MYALSVFLAFFPVLVVGILLVAYRMAADYAGYVGWGVAALLAYFWFNTPLEVIGTSTVAGIVASFPIAFVFGAAIWQITVMHQAGAMARIVALMKGIAPGQKAVQLLLINVGFGVLLTSLGAPALSILPPIMLAMGYSAISAILLPSLGYVAMCTYALLGIPAVVFANFVGLPLEAIGDYFARYMLVLSVVVAFALLHIVGGTKLMREGFVPALLTGLLSGVVAQAMSAAGLVTLTGIAAGMAIVLGLLLYLKATGRPLYDRSLLGEADFAAEKKFSLVTAASPWLMLVVFSLATNAPFLPFLKWIFVDFAMPVEIIPNSPERLRIFWQGYFWVIISTLVCLPFLKLKMSDFAKASVLGLRRAMRPVLCTMVFFAIAFVMNHSGKGADWALTNPLDNMIVLMADAAAATFGTMYPIVAPVLGLLGGFIGGSETSGVAMLTQLHLSTAETIGASGVLLAAASAIAAGMAGVISPAKLQTAAASINRIDDASKAIRPAFAISIILTAVCAVMTWYWC